MEYIESPSRRWAVWQNIYRRQFLLENDLYFPVGMVCEDVAWTYRAFLKSKSVGYFDRVFYQYIADRKQSIMNTISYQRWHDLVSHCQTWFGDLQNIGNQVLSEALRAIFIHLIYLSLDDVIHFSREELEEVKEFLKQIPDFKAPTNAGDIKKLRLINRIGFRYYIHYRKVVITSRFYLMKVFKKLKKVVGE